MNSGGDAFYAVVIICLFVFLLLIACISIRMRRRYMIKKQQLAQGEHAGNEWEQLRTVVTHSAEEDQVIQWQSKYPPDTTSYIDVAKHPHVIDQGVLAWKFIETETVDSEEESNAAIMEEDASNIIFCQGQGNIMTNLPVPMQEFSYYEVKILQLNKQDTLSIGFATKPYPRWRLPGWHRHSVAYHSNTGHIYASASQGRPYGPSYSQGDVIGVGYLYQSGTVFFTRNGQNLGKASIGFKYPLYPIIGSIGPCHVSTNVGLQDFLFSAANQREAAYGPKQGSLLPPPAYDGHKHDVLFEQDYTTTDHLNYPPSYS